MTVIRVKDSEWMRQPFVFSLHQCDLNQKPFGAHCPIPAEAKGNIGIEERKTTWGEGGWPSLPVSSLACHGDFVLRTERSLHLNIFTDERFLTQHRLNSPMYSSREHTARVAIAVLPDSGITLTIEYTDQPRTFCSVKCENFALREELSIFVLDPERRACTTPSACGRAD